MDEITRIEGWYNNISSGKKLIVSIVAGFFGAYLIDLEGWQLKLLAGWDITCLVLIVLSWASFISINDKQIRYQATRQDESRAISFVFIIIAAVLSLLGIILVFSSSSLPIRPRWQMLFSLISVMLSWILIHTLFTLRYAHLYYQKLKLKPGEHGLIFPNDLTPGYLDFAYFSFVIGMTFQVSDVGISSKKIRKIVLFHGLVSFAFNTFIVAVLVNMIAGWK